MKPTSLLLLLSSLLCCTTNSVRLTASPSSSQLFEYDSLSLSCEDSSSSHGWKIIRSTTSGGKMSSCGEEWGTRTSTGCILQTTKQPDSATYWCESPTRQRSNSLNISIYGGPVILQSPVLPVMEGDNVTLLCRTKTSSSLPAGFYKNGSLIGREPTGHMTIRHVSKSDEGLYRCDNTDGESPSSWLLMKDDSDPAALSASPDSSQLFEYDSLSLSCGDSSSSHGWKIIRSTTSGGKMSSCGEEWGTPTSVGCTFPTTKQPDSATYWCESPTRQRSNSLNISIYGGPVILQSPVLPVMEGDNVSLVCRTKTSSSLPAGFYKDGSLIGREPTGHMTIRHVSKSDEGLYRCDNTDGESPSSWLLVSEKPSTTTSPQLTELLPAVVLLLVVLVVLVVLVGLVGLVGLARQCTNKTPNAARVKAGDDGITYSTINTSRNPQQPIRQGRESDPAVVYSAVRRAEDVSYGQIVIRDVKSNRTREFPPEQETIYSILK